MPKKTKKKTRKDIPAIPKGVVSGLIWFATYYTAKFILILFSIALIVALSSVGIVLSRNGDGISIEKIEKPAVDIRIGKPKK